VETLAEKKRLQFKKLLEPGWSAPTLLPMLKVGYLHDFIDNGLCTQREGSYCEEFVPPVDRFLAFFLLPLELCHLLLLK